MNLEAPHRRRGVLYLIGMIMTVLVLAGCQAYKEGGKRTFGQFTDDAGIQTAVKSALIRDAEIKGWPMNVDVYKGVVSLYGRVPSETARSRALKIAGDVRGVVRVEDRLTLVAPN